MFESVCIVNLNMYSYVNTSFTLWNKSPFVLKLYTVVYYHAYQAVLLLK